jgi:protein-tyrosine-phosphatase
LSSILFVCTANQIRSPLAQEILLQLLNQRGEYLHWRVESAGTWAFDGAPAHWMAVRSARNYDLDLSGHRSRTISIELLQEFSLVFVMDRFQLEALTFEFPSHAAKIHLLSELIGKTFDIKDPVTGTVQDVDETAAQIKNILDEGFDQLVQMAG